VQTVETNAQIKLAATEWHPLDAALDDLDLIAMLSRNSTSSALQHRRRNIHARIPNALIGPQLKHRDAATAGHVENCCTVWHFSDYTHSPIDPINVRAHHQTREPSGNGLLLHRPVIARAHRPRERRALPYPAYVYHRTTINAYGEIAALTKTTVHWLITHDTVMTELDVFWPAAERSAYAGH
jgi:hypothetical protein